MKKRARRCWLRGRVLGILRFLSSEETRRCGGFSRHAKEFAERLASGKARGERHCFRDSRKSVVQTPGVATGKFPHGLEIGTGDRGQEAHWHQSRCKGVMDERLCLDVGENACLELFHFAYELPEMFLKAKDGSGEFNAQVEPGCV